MSGWRFVCLTLHDRLSGFGEARSAAVEMGGGLVADVAVPRRAEPGELRVDPTAGARGGEREAGTVERLPGQAARPVLIPGWRGLRRALPIS